MKVQGTIIRTDHARQGVTLIIDTPLGMRGIELEPDLWAEVVADFGLTPGADLSGWRVEYDPTRGDLELIGFEPDDADGTEDPGAWPT